MWKKTLALLLVLAMLVGFSGNFAFTAHAEEATTPKVRIIATVIATARIFFMFVSFLR